MSEQENTEQEYTDVELSAMERGWRPREEWEGDNGEWVDAEEFNKRGELMDTISSLNKRDKLNNDRIKNLEDALKKLGEHNKKIAEKEYEKALKDLKRQKIIALESEDHETVLEVEERIDQVKEAKREFESSNQEVVEPQNTEASFEIESWKSRNSWYNTNIALRGAADAFADDFMRKFPEKASNVHEALAYVDSNMKTSFPEMFNGKRRPSNTTESEGSNRSSKSKFTVRDLNPTQRKFAETFVRTGAMKNIQEYVDQLVELGELK